MSSTPRAPRTYAPGYGLLPPKSSAAGKQECQGCDVGDALPECAACGKPAAVVLPPVRVGVSSGHALPLCLRCWRVVRKWKAEEAARKRKQQKQTKPRRRSA